MTNTVRAIGFLFLAIALSGCGAPPGGGGGGGGADLTDEQREAALDDVGTMLEALPGTDVAADNQALAESLSDRPEFEAAGVSDDSCVWGRFTDGELLIVVNNRPHSDAGPIVEATTQRLTRTDGTPKDTQVRLLNGMGTCFSSPVTTLSTWFDDNGYTVVGGDSTVEELKTVADDGVFYIDAHGGNGSSRAGPVFGVWTATEASIRNSIALRDDLRDGSLCYMVAAHDSKGSGRGCTTEKHYAITSQFVRKYMSFGEDSMVFINACSSLNTDFAQACFDQGAGAYWGWTQPVGDREAFVSAKYLFDRLLGANAYPQHPEDPPQRAFLKAGVIVDMWDEGLGKYAGPPESTLVYQENPAADDHDPELLAPSIFFCEVYDNLEERPEGELTILGWFGDRPGKVFVGGTEIPVDTWENDEIHCFIPPSGAGSAGDVVVSVEGRRSNARQLTEWRGQFKLTVQEIENPSLKVVTTCNLHIRQDIGYVRLQAGHFTETRETFFWTVSDSTATFEASGSTEYEDGGDTVTVSWSTLGSGELPIGQGPGPGWLFLGDFDPVVPEISGIILSSQAATIDGVDAGILETVTRTAPDGTVTTSTDKWSFYFSVSFAVPPNDPVAFSVDDNAGIVAGHLEGEYGAGGEHYIAEWDAIPATFPPDDAAARALGVRGGGAGSRLGHDLRPRFDPLSSAMRATAGRR